jgi:hypothetical protein
LYSFQLFSAEVVRPKQEEISLAEKWRPTIEKYLGEDFAIKLLGKSTDIKNALDPITKTQIMMPKIPVIKVDARSAEIYTKKPDKIILKPEEEEKFLYSFLSELYEVTRQAKPSEQEFGKMMNTLSQGATREGVYHALVLDAAYAQLESTDKPVKVPASEFAIYFYSIYIAKIISPESLQKMNMYSLKRLVAEKAIEVIDAFGDNRDDMEKWYAMLSADLATRFPQHWANMLRKNTSKGVHKKWASKAPIQHIKSEIVIKLHTAFNSLM